MVEIKTINEERVEGYWNIIRENLLVEPLERLNGFKIVEGLDGDFYKVCAMNKYGVRDVLEQIKEHPCFDGEIFDERNYDALVEIGGDIATITGWAISLDDAINDK